MSHEAVLCKLVNVFLFLGEEIIFF
jgi:hypothetical protein